MASLLEKYRPRALSEVRGQPGVVRSLTRFCKAPYPVAMLFAGPSGVGKTCAARCLAAGLGVSPGDAGLGGYHEIASGEMTGAAVREAVRALHFRPMLSPSGWRVLVCNEADRMTESAETIWLDALEKLPQSCVVVFTTNAPEAMTQRFRDRCEVYAFEGRAERLRPAIKKLAAEVWAGEVGRGACPHLDIVGMPTLLGPDSMHASFRLALQQLAQYVREAVPGGDLAAVRERLEESLTAGYDCKAGCDHCGAEQPCRMGQRSKKCSSCKRQFAIDWAASEA